MNTVKRILRYIKLQGNPSLREEARAQQIKIAFVTNNDNLPPDTYVTKKLNWHFRKYMVDGEIRNAINLKGKKYGSINIGSTSDYLKFAIGWKAEKETEGNIKIRISKNGIERDVFDKDVGNLLYGWNENKITVKEKRYMVEWVNTIDEDIYLSISVTPQTKQKKNIVVIIFDGVNPRLIGLYQNKPRHDYISRYFQCSTMYNNAYAQGEWTTPNITSMLTSLYSSHHKVSDPDTYLRSISYDVPVLAEVLQQNGFNTMGYFGHNRVSAGYGFARGFNRFYYRCVYDEHTQRKKKQVKSDVKVADIQQRNYNNLDAILNSIRFLKDNQDTDNFIFLHIYDTHRPFFQTNLSISNSILSKMNSNPVTELAQEHIDNKTIQYLQGIHEQTFYDVDSNLGLLFDYIEKYEEPYTTVILTSDHGNVYYDEGIINFFPFYDRNLFLKPSLLKVPLFIKSNEKKLRCCNDFVEANICIMPTVLQLMDVEIPDKLDGVSVRNGKGYTITESNFTEFYEVVVKTEKFTYFLRTKRDRANMKMIYDVVYEIYRDRQGEILTDVNHCKEIKEDAMRILQKEGIV